MPFLKRLNAFALFTIVSSLALIRSAAADDGEKCWGKLIADMDQRIAVCNQYINTRSIIGERGKALSFGYFGRGLAYYEKGDFDRAISDFNDAIRADATYARVYFNRARAYSERGANDQAKSDYDEAIRLNPKYAVALNNRGNIYFDKGDVDRAISDYTAAIRSDPKFALAYVNRGRALLKKGDHERALLDTKTAIRVDPKASIGYFELGNVFRAKGACDAALKAYDEALRIDPLEPQFLTARGLCYESNADVAKAREDFKAAIAVSSKEPRDKAAQSQAKERLAALPPAPTGATSPSSSAGSAAISSVLPAINDNRIALVIGNSAYENVPALTNPERDATLVANTLKQTGFRTVSFQTNLRKDALVAALRDFAAKAEKADWAVVYYAGHGMEIGGTNYLIPVDAKIAADRDIGFEAVPLEQVLNATERAGRLRLVILDACRDNPFKAKMKRTLTVASRSVSGGLAAIEPEAGTLVVYAAKDGQQALDGDGINSPFALAFVKNLQTPGLEVRRLFDYVRDDVLEMTHRQQQPFSYGSISGRQDFYFVAK
jgi:tetratricopeptide (TPR) repeat protein